MKQVQVKGPLSVGAPQQLQHSGNYTENDHTAVTLFDGDPDTFWWSKHKKKVSKPCKTVRKRFETT